MKIVINNCFGGFSLSDEAYEKLIEWGVPVKAYTKEPRNTKTGLYDVKPKENEGEIIFDRKLGTIGETSESENKLELLSLDFLGRYWETWIDDNRTHPLLIRVVKELKKKANGRCAELKIVEIPDGVEYEIDEYDGLESIHEKHRSWN